MDLEAVIRRTRVSRRRVLEIVSRQGLPVTTAATTVLDLVADHHQSHWRDAVHLMARWVHSNKVSAAEVLEALALRDRYPRRSLVTAALEPIAEGIESILELDSLNGVILRHGLPRPTLQHEGTVQRARSARARPAAQPGRCPGSEEVRVKKVLL